MIIGFDASRAFLNNKTGTENYSYQLLLNLAKIDRKNQYKVFLRPNSVIARNETTTRLLSSERSDGGQEQSQNKIAALPAVARNDGEKWPDNFEFITIPYPRLWTQAGLARQTFKQELDLLFIPSHTLPLIRKPGLKTVVTVHDLGAEYLPQTHQLKQKLYLNFMTHHQLKSATHLIAVSNATKIDLIKKVKISPKNITVIYEGYDKSLFKPQKTDELKSVLNYYELESNNYFLFVGTIQPRKNLERLIKAYATFLKTIDDRKWKVDVEDRGLKLEKTQDLSSNFYHQKSTFHPPSSTIKLVLAGSKGWMSDEIYELPKKLGIQNQVKFLGYVPDEKLPALYSGAIAFLFPSLFEGFGLPLLEAMACGCPVLTSNISSLPEVAGKAAILVNPDSEEEIAQGISKLFSDQNLRKRLKKLGIAQVRKFSWEKCAKQTLDLFEQISS